jgi:hypothetical protein
LVILIGFSVRSLRTITPETEIIELGPEQYQVINSCKLTNLHHLVAIAWWRYFKRQTENILGWRQIQIGNSADLVQQQEIEHCNSSFICLTHFTAS